MIYQLRVEEHLDTEMAAWFAPLQVVNQPNGVATLTGPVVDQAALHGLINKVFNMNLTLLSVHKLEGNR